MSIHMQTNQESSSLTSNPCGRSYDNIDMSFGCMLIPPRCFDRPIHGGGDCVSGMRVLGRPVHSWKYRQGGFGRCCRSHFGVVVTCGSDLLRVLGFQEIAAVMTF